MTLQQQLHPATFKNVPFLVTGTNTSGGRKTVTHEFVNSDQRNVEDLGLLQKTFTLTAIITGAQYTQKRDSLIRVLEEGGRGELVHPFFGRVNVVAKPYTVVENFAELGEARFSLEFERSEDNPQPQPSGSTIQTVANRVNEVFDSLEQNIADFFDVSPSFPRNFIAAQNVLGNISVGFKTATSRVRNSVSGLNAFNATLRDFTGSANGLILDADALSNSIVGVFTTMRGIATTSIEYIEILAGLYGFGDDETETELTTAELVERNTNNNLLNNMMQGGSLADSYRFVVTIDFDTVTDIDTAQKILDNQYEAIVETLPTPTQLILNDLRSQVREFLDDQRISAKRIINIETKTIPAQVLTYSLYGTVTDTEKIIEVNEIKDVSFVEGEVQVLT